VYESEVFTCTQASLRKPCSGSTFRFYAQWSRGLLRPYKDDPISGLLEVRARGIYKKDP
jgi:hypothetical protein